MNRKSQDSSEPAEIDRDEFTKLVMGTLAERYKNRPELRHQFETIVRESIPTLLAGRERGDFYSAIENWSKQFEALISQREANERLIKETIGQDAFEAAIKEGDIAKAFQEMAFTNLKWTEFRNLKHYSVQFLLELAKRDGDEALIKKLARALEEKPQSIHDIQPDKAKVLLITYWVKLPKLQIGLCRLTDEALVEFVNIALGRTTLSLDAIRKLRQRLGLKKGPEPHFTKVKKTDDGIAIE